MEDTKRTSPKKVAKKKKAPTKSSTLKVARKKRSTAAPTTADEVPAKKVAKKQSAPKKKVAKKSTSKKAAAKKRSSTPATPEEKNTEASLDQKESTVRKVSRKRAAAHSRKAPRLQKNEPEQIETEVSSTPEPKVDPSKAENNSRASDQENTPKEQTKATQKDREQPSDPPKKENKRLLSLSQKGSDVYLPARIPFAVALKRTTHLAVFAHQDDQELGAFHGINKCYDHSKKWFTGVILTDGGGSNQSDKYPNASIEEMCRIRKNEQRRAAQAGRYSAQIQLAHHSDRLKDNANAEVIDELVDILNLTQPEHIYTHSPFDKHPSHRNAFNCLLQAIRKAQDCKPKNIYGCEIWGSLEWLPQDYRKTFSLGDHPELLEELLECFPSQVQDNRPYDIATMGRHLANATFADPHTPPSELAVSYALQATKFCLSKKKLISFFAEIQKAQKEEFTNQWKEDQA